MIATNGTMPRRKRDIPTATIRVDEDLVPKIKMAAAASGKDPPEYVSDLLRPVLDKEMAKLGRRLSQHAESND